MLRILFSQDCKTIDVCVKPDCMLTQGPAFEGWNQIYHTYTNHIGKKYMQKIFTLGFGNFEGFFVNIFGVSNHFLRSSLVKVYTFWHMPQKLLLPSHLSAFAQTASSACWATLWHISLVMCFVNFIADTCGVSFDKENRGCPTAV